MCDFGRRMHTRPPDFWPLYGLLLTSHIRRAKARQHAETQTVIYLPAFCSAVFMLDETTHKW